jgi:hypothetical protein
MEGENMKTKILVGIAVLFAVILVAPAFASGGFDEFGYNYQARVFVGKADGVDRVLDGTVWGDKTYAKDLLVVKWNAEWDRGNDEGWTKGPYSAWCDNEWNGAVPGGSGEVWHYKIIWVGPTGLEDGTPMDNGGYAIWGQFEVILDHGTTADHVHEFFAHAIPTGYGA